MKLVVSEVARQEDRARKEQQEKKAALEESRRNMLAKLTKQLQACLARVQSDELDEAGKEKYQDMINTLKSQMAKISIL